MADEFRNALLEAVGLIKALGKRRYNTDNHLYGMVQKSDILTQRFGSLLSVYMGVNQSFAIDMINQYKTAKKCEQAILAALVRVELSND